MRTVQQNATVVIFTGSFAVSNDVWPFV